MPDLVTSVTAAPPAVVTVDSSAGGRATAQVRVLTAACDANPTLRRQLNRFAFSLLIQIAQTALVNASFSIEERLARWLLMCADRLAGALITAGIIETGLELYNLLLPIYGHRIGLTASEIGMILGAFGFALLIVRSLMPHLVKRFSEERVLSGSLLLATAVCLAFPFVKGFAALFLISFVMGVGLGCGSPLSMMLAYNRAPEGRSGEAMGLRQMVNKGTEVLVPFVFGTLSTALGMVPVFWLDAVLLQPHWRPRHWQFRDSKFRAQVLLEFLRKFCASPIWPLANSSDKTPASDPLPHGRQWQCLCAPGPDPQCAAPAHPNPSCPFCRRRFVQQT